VGLAEPAVTQRLMLALALATAFVLVRMAQLSPSLLRRVRMWLLMWPPGSLLGRPLRSLWPLQSLSPAAGPRERAALRSASALMSPSLLAPPYSSQWVAQSAAL